MNPDTISAILAAASPDSSIDAQGLMRLAQTLNAQPGISTSAQILAAAAPISAMAAGQAISIDGCKAGDPVACSDVLARARAAGAANPERSVEAMSGNTVTCGPNGCAPGAPAPRRDTMSNIVLVAIAGVALYAGIQFVRGRR